MAKISEEILNQILKLNEDGLINTQISNQINISIYIIKSHLKKHNRHPNLFDQKINLVSDTEARCSKCFEIKNINQFQWGRKGKEYEYKFSYCNFCRKRQIYLNLNNDINIYLSDRFNRLKVRCKKYNIICSISKKEFISIYHNQSGLCFYTGETMICKVGNKLSRYSLSVDKIVPDLGYTYENTVFCTHKINTIKSDLSLDEIEKWMPFFFQKIQTHIKKFLIDEF